MADTTRSAKLLALVRGRTLVSMSQSRLFLLGQYYSLRGGIVLQDADYARAARLLERDKNYEICRAVVTVHLRSRGGRK